MLRKGEITVERQLEKYSLDVYFEVFRKPSALADG